MGTPNELATRGKAEREIRVSISYRIIELFSAGLYSSPHKALEELVANSYDATASAAHVVVPDNLETNDAVIWVLDDGESMDFDGFEQLWKIASSNKRDPDRESSERPPIGKFGIGKLATYVLASQLTFVCKSDGEFRAVTMDFSQIDESQEAGDDLVLRARSLTEEDAKAILGPLLRRRDAASDALPLFGETGLATWTVAAMANLKPLAHRLQQGRLRWVLATALPLSPGFALYLNGERLQPSKETLRPLKTWNLGGDDGAASKLKLTCVDGSGVKIAGLGIVSGTAQVYETNLTGGKSEAWGRSHGIFVMVRKRLINIDDATFGISRLPLGPLARFRLEIHADGLDEVLRSTREAVLETEGVQNLRDYIVAKFNEVRAWYQDWLARKEYEERIATRLGATPLSLSRRPLYNAIRLALGGEVAALYLTRLPAGLDEAGRQGLIDELEEELSSDQGLIREVSFDALGMEHPIAVFDVEHRTVRVNMLHPFYANYAEHYQNPEPFELLAVAEVLTEGYLLEVGLAPDQVGEVLERRDRFLRELVFSRQLSAPLVAQLIKDSTASSKGLEVAVAEGLRSLGLEVSPIGGNGKPDGTALARLGVRDWDSGERADYKLTYDAKSSANPRVKAHTVGVSTIARHRKDYEADFALVVAPGFEGDGDNASAVVKEAREHGPVTLITARDFVRLVLLAASRQLGFSRLRGLFEKCSGPHESRAWIDAIQGEQVEEGPVQEILEAIWELQKESPDPVKFAAVRMQSDSLKRFREKEIAEWMQSVRRMAGGFVSIQGEVVSLEAPPEKILGVIRVHTSRLPEMLAALQSESAFAAGASDDR